MSSNSVSTAVPRLIPGLVSVTFRQYDVQQIVELVSAQGLSAIEWGGDVHVPVGESATAERVRDLCSARNVRIISYGSYWRAANPNDFAPVVSTATALGAPSIRVWAGERGSAETSPSERATIVANLNRAIEEAGENDLGVALEFHRNTLTDTVESTLQLLDEVDGPLRTYWQPGRATPPDVARDQVRALAPHLSTVHVFSWGPDGTRQPLAVQEDMWQAVLAELPDRTNALLEFVAGDDPEAYARDAQTLLGWLGRSS